MPGYLNFLPISGSWFLFPTDADLGRPWFGSVHLLPNLVGRFWIAFWIKASGVSPASAAVSVRVSRESSVSPSLFLSLKYSKKVVRKEDLTKKNSMILIIDILINYNSFNFYSKISGGFISLIMHIIYSRPVCILHILQICCITWSKLNLCHF